MIFDCFVPSGVFGLISQKELNACFAQQKVVKDIQMFLSLRNLAVYQKIKANLEKEPWKDDTFLLEMAPHSSILPRKSHGRRILVGFVPWGC